VSPRRGCSRVGFHVRVVWFQVPVRLIDKPNPTENPNLGFVLHDAVTVLEQLPSEGRTVLLHCVQAQSRTPTVAALYGAKCFLLLLGVGPVCDRGVALIVENQRGGAAGSIRRRLSGA